MKKIKLFIELIFIFILPIVLIACCFNIKKEYDSNGNEINRSLEFNNIFELYGETVNYIKGVESFVYNVYDYHSSDPGILVNFSDYNIFAYGYAYGVDYADVLVNFGINYIDFDNNEVSVMIDIDDEILLETLFDLDQVLFDNVYNYCFIFDLNELINYTVWSGIDEFMGHELNDHINYIELHYYYFDYYILSENAISKVINYLYSSLGIQENYILQIIVIYTLLWLIMWFIWHLIYLPLDFLSGILIRKVDYEKS